MLKQMLQQRLASLTGLAPPAAPRYRRDRQASAAAEPKRGRAAVQLSPWSIVLQAVLHDPTRAGRVGELPESGPPEAAALATVLAILREHPEMPTRDLVEHFRGHPEQAALEHAAAGLLEWEKDGEGEYDVEADFLGAMKTLAEQAGRAQVNALAGRKPSEMSPAEKARLLASLQRR
jgi:hypothetical protein